MISILQQLKYQNTVLSSFIIYHRVSNKSDTTDVTCRAGTSYLSGVPEFSPAYYRSGVRVVQCRRKKIQDLRYQIAVLLCCPIEYIIPDGVEPTDSVYVTFMIPEWCIDVLMKIQPEDKATLNSFGVDRFKVGDDYVDCKGKKNVCLLDGA
jgi:hypothetical protein